MKVVSLQLAFSASVLATIFSGICRADDTPAPSAQDLQAKIQYCSTCHQPTGQGYLGASPIPRLAGQQTEYFENQLQAFIERRRQNTFMFNAAHLLSPTMRSALARHFSELHPKPLGGAPAGLVAAGEKIYQEGVPSADVPPCFSCHGPEAKGEGPIPRLAGQLYPYVIKSLVNWNKLRGLDPANPDTSATMAPIAHGLTELQIADVAAYLANLE